MENPSEYLTREVPLRRLAPLAPWLRGRVGGRAPGLARCPVYRRVLGGDCREIFAGSGGCSRVLVRAGLWVEAPLDVFPPGGACRIVQVIDKPPAKYILECDIAIGFLRCANFGLPCSSLCRANQLNGGARSTAYPDGSPQALERELIGNSQAPFVVPVCFPLNACRSIFTIENPAAVSKSSYVAGLCTYRCVVIVVLHQGSFGFQQPLTYDQPCP